MKYIKTYEDESKKYDVGDYIILNFETDVKTFLENNVPDYEDIAKIIQIEVRAFLYKVEFNNGYDFNVKENEILRLASPNEIDEYETKISARIYNL